MSTYWNNFVFLVLLRACETTTPFVIRLSPKNIADNWQLMFVYIADNSFFFIAYICFEQLVVESSFNQYSTNLFSHKVFVETFFPISGRNYQIVQGKFCTKCCSTICITLGRKWKNKPDIAGVYIKQIEDVVDSFHISQRVRWKLKDMGSQSWPSPFDDCQERHDHHVYDPGRICCTQVVRVAHTRPLASWVGLDHTVLWIRDDELMEGRIFYTPFSHENDILVGYHKSDLRSRVGERRSWMAACSSTGGSTTSRAWALSAHRPPQSCRASEGRRSYWPTCRVFQGCHASCTTPTHSRAGTAGSSHDSSWAGNHNLEHQEQG